MKRFWMFVLLVAGSLAVLTAPAVVMADDENGGDTLESLREDMNTALGTQASRMSDIEKQLGIKLMGDIRIRYAFKSQLNNSADKQGTISDQSYGRYRVRFGATKQFGDFLAGFRLTTAPGGNPNTENNTFDTSFDNPTIGIDQAYISWVPSLLNKNWKVVVGKMPNPVVNTPISWDPDIVPEGALIEANYGDMKIRGTWWELQNVTNYASESQIVAPGSLATPDTGLNKDEYMDNVQLDYLFKFDTDTNALLTLGYEYIPYATSLAGGTIGFYTNAPTQALGGNKGLVGNGNIWDYGKVLPDFQVGEAILSFNHKVSGVPFKWTFHFTDNFDSFNVPNYSNATIATNTAAQNAAAKKADGYTTESNQYAFYAGVNIGTIVNPGDFAGLLAVAYIEPNATMAWLTDDDPSFTNRQYLKESLSYGLASGVNLVATAWQIERVYYGANVGVTPGASLGGGSNDPYFVNYLDAVASF
jgi:hypothetical protein